MVENIVLGVTMNNCVEHAWMTLKPSLMLIYSIYGFQIAACARELSLKNDKGTNRNHQENPARSSEWGRGLPLTTMCLYATNFWLSFFCFHRLRTYKGMIAFYCPESYCGLILRAGRKIELITKMVKVRLYVKIGPNSVSLWFFLYSNILRLYITYKALLAIQITITCEGIRRVEVNEGNLSVKNMGSTSIHNTKR